jgi:cation:H+ antiporter
MIPVWLKFAVCTIMIFFSGKRVAKYGDVIAEKTGLSGLWIGVILVAIATSLPEIFTGVGSTVFVNAPDLTVGNLFGANTYNLLNVSLLDFLNKGSPLLSSVSIGQLLTAGLSLVPLLIASIGIFLSIRLPQLSFMNISLYSILILIGYLVAIKTIFKFERNQQQIMRELKKEEEILLKYNGISLKRACILYGVFAIMIAGAGIWLAYIGEDLARLLSLGQNFIGGLFLSFATTLPEITVSVAALRIGAKELAVANMLGSNLFNMSIIFLNDVLYRKAPIFNFLSQQHIFTGFIVMLMTVIVCTGLILKPKKKTKLGLSNYAITLITVFILGAYLNFILVRR